MDLLANWDERFSSANSDGKNNDGDYPIHIISRDGNASFQAVKVVVDERKAETSTRNKQGHFPFFSAAKSGSRLDVIFYLLKHNPDALSEQRCAHPSITHAINNETDIGRSTR